MLEIGKKTVPHTIAPPSRKRKRCFLGKTEMIGCIWLTKKLGGSGNKNHPGFLISCSFHHSYVFQWIKVNWLHSIHGIHYNQKHVAFCIRRLTNQRFFVFLLFFFWRSGIFLPFYRMECDLSCRVFCRIHFSEPHPVGFCLALPIQSTLHHLWGISVEDAWRGNLEKVMSQDGPSLHYRYKYIDTNGAP